MSPKRKKEKGVLRIKKNVDIQNPFDSELYLLYQEDYQII